LTILRSGAQLCASAAHAAWRAWRTYNRLPAAQSRSFLRRTGHAVATSLAHFDLGVSSAEADAVGIGHSAMTRLRDEARGLHELLRQDEYGYSILLGQECPEPSALEMSLAACRDLSAPRVEILVGSEGLDADTAAILRRFDGGGAVLRHVPVTDRGQLWSTLVSAAAQPHLLLVTPGDWLRPDLLYRYELVLRAERERARIALTCSSRGLGPSGDLLPPVGSVTSEQPHFPLTFCTNALSSGALVPRPLALEAVRHGHTTSALDIVFGAVVAGARFVHVPIPLRAAPSRRADLPRRVVALRRYFDAAEVGWRVDDAGRVFAGLRHCPTLQVIVLYRDEPERTLACIGSVRAQAYPSLTITAIDNRSRNAAFAEALRQDGVDVIPVDEPFNFSRLNNCAARRSTSDLILFLNNDVVLKPGALAELISWGVQEPVGLVGPALFYPDGRLQHGGIERNPFAPAQQGGWEDVERGRRRASLDRATRQRVVDAVTGACAMMRREVFDSVQGFDEVNYPIAFSDTDLAQRIRMLGLACVYTPFAEGVHDESASRRYARLEDFEGSQWFARVLGRT
jgi:GT2 family glycosyltransferase